MTSFAPRLGGLAPLLLAWILVGCGPGAADPTPEVPSAPGTPNAEPLTIRFAAFTTVREAYEKRIIPLFVEQWRRNGGVEVRFEQSYGASTDQASAIVNGLEADVAALSNEEDVDTLVHAGLVRPEWHSGSHGGIVSRSVVVLAVRPGNPGNVHDWRDLTRSDLRIVMPDPARSGGGRWGVAAMYGTILRGPPGGPAGTPPEAERFLAQVFRRVIRWSPDARSSFEAFEQGTGDVAITSESELMRSRMFGHEVEWVVPKSTLRMDNPAVVVDANVDRHGVRGVAEAFLEFLVGKEAESAFLLRGFRPVAPAPSTAEPDPAEREADVWGIEELGGWRQVRKDLFAPDAVFERAQAASREE